MIVQTGLYPGGKIGEAGTCFDLLEQNYPAFIKNNETYTQWHNLWLNHEWNARWNAYMFLEKDTVLPGDSILLDIRIKNRSRETQSLDTAFLNQWNKQLYMHIYRRPENGCQEMSGDFVLKPLSNKIHSEARSVAAGKSYSERFLLEIPSAGKTYPRGKFQLTPGYTYDCIFEFRTPKIPWIRTNPGRAVLYIP